ncbi:hypothetical protein TNCV_4482731 [Trichonephila clavipes]|nr:hypothetical protein TNCV_4482731 [Trichonephila clavipes]
MLHGIPGVLENSSRQSCDRGRWTKGFMNTDSVESRQLLSFLRDSRIQMKNCRQADSTPVLSVEDIIARLSVAAGRTFDMPGITQNIRNSMTATAGSDVVQSGRPIFDDFFQHLWPYIGNNTANVVFQMVKRLWLIRIDQ